MSKSNGGRISADWEATSTSLTIKYNVKHIFLYYKMGRKIPVFVKGGAPKNNTDTSHGISVFSYGENPTEFFCIDCLVPVKSRIKSTLFIVFVLVIVLNKVISVIYDRKHFTEREKKVPLTVNQGQTREF
jgi:hypothetical protein